MPAMNGLTHADLSKLKRQLEREACDVRKLMQDEFNRRSARGAGDGAYRERVDDEAIADAVEDRVPALIASCAATTAAIEKGLAAMRAGTYGACEGCGRPIGLTRLRALPTATRCRDCAA